MARTRYHGTLEPLRPRSNTILFHDWRYVYHGTPIWKTQSGEYLGLWSQGQVPRLARRGQDIPMGIEIRALPGVKGKPFLVPDRPWEGAVLSPTVIRTGETYRLWYECVPPSDFGTERAGHFNVLCYAESRDGESWEKPSLGLVGFGRSKDNNIVYGGEMAAGHGYHGGSVFLDPSAGEGERYKLIHLGFLRDDEFERIAAERGGEVDPMVRRGHIHSAVFGATSPDGLRWTPIEEPLCLQNSDTQNIAYYDESLERYVAYMRMWVMNRRSIGRSESRDFRRFPLPETLVWPGPDVGPSDLWYSSGKTRYPGAPDHHLMFAWRWNVATDRFHVHVLASPEGVIWTRPLSSEVLSPGPDGSWDAGGVVAGCGMVEIGREVAVPIVGFHIPHKHTRCVPLGRIAWAKWPKDRIIGLVAPEQGKFRTMLLRVKARGLRVNIRTAEAGEARFGISDEAGSFLEGRSPEDCDPLSGDFYDREVTWRGDPAIDHEGPIAVHVRMSHAELFCMRFS